MKPGPPTPTGGPGPQAGALRARTRTTTEKEGKGAARRRPGGAPPALIVCLAGRGAEPRLPRPQLTPAAWVPSELQGLRPGPSIACAHATRMQDPS